MVTFIRFSQLARSLSGLNKLMKNATSNSCNSSLKNAMSWQNSSMFHTSPRVNGLMEFFDEKENWGKSRIKTGRSWTKDELRLKSNEDLHKLWFVLLKERNMLKTMEHAHNEEYRVFANPERVDKVEDSMENLEYVVRERNKAYHLLEIGEHGERPSEIMPSVIGNEFWYRKCQHKIPKNINSGWARKHFFGDGGAAGARFRIALGERLGLMNRKSRNSQTNHVRQLFKRFPNLDVEALKAKYPDVNIEKARRHKRSTPHMVPE